MSLLTFLENVGSTSVYRYTVNSTQYRFLRIENPVKDVSPVGCVLSITSFSPCDSIFPETCTKISGGERSYTSPQTFLLTQLPCHKQWTEKYKLDVKDEYINQRMISNSQAHVHTKVGAGLSLFCADVAKKNKKFSSILSFFVLLVLLYLFIQCIYTRIIRIMCIVL